MNIVTVNGIRARLSSFKSVALQRAARAILRAYRRQRVTHGLIATIFLPLLLLSACVSVQPIDAPDQPELARLATPYVEPMRAVGITRLISAGSGAMVRLETFYGAVYVRYPRDVPPLAFVLEVDPDGFHAAATSVDRERAAAALAAILPVAINETARNNAFQWLRANPWR